MYFADNRIGIFTVILYNEIKNRLNVNNVIPGNVNQKMNLG